MAQASSRSDFNDVVPNNFCQHPVVSSFELDAALLQQMGFAFTLAFMSWVVEDATFAVRVALKMLLS